MAVQHEEGRVGIAVPEKQHSLCVDYGRNATP
jgi:hypothetical protein